MLRALPAAVVLASSLALAQAAVAPAAGGSPPAGAAAAPAAPADAPVFSRPTTVAEPPESRGFRWGISAGAGTFLPGPLVSFGSELRAGWQFNRMFSAYLSAGGNGGFGIGGSVTTTGGSMFIGADSYWYIGAQGEVMLGDVFFVAGGPQLARGGWGFVGQSVDINGGVSQVARATGGGFMPALDVKVGFGFGKPAMVTGRRGQFTLSVDTMFLFAPNTVTGSQSVTVNGVSQMVDTRGTAVGIAPVLMLGYDAR